MDKGPNLLHIGVKGDVQKSKSKEKDVDALKSTQMPEQLSNDNMSTLNQCDQKAKKSCAVQHSAETKVDTGDEANKGYTNLTKDVSTLSQAPKAKSEVVPESESHNKHLKSAKELSQKVVVSSDPTLLKEKAAKNKSITVETSAEAALKDTETADDSHCDSTDDASITSKVSSISMCNRYSRPSVNSLGIIKNTNYDFAIPDVVSFTTIYHKKKSKWENPASYLPLKSGEIEEVKEEKKMSEKDTENVKTANLLHDNHSQSSLKKRFVINQDGKITVEVDVSKDDRKLISSHDSHLSLNERFMANKAADNTDEQFVDTCMVKGGSYTSIPNEKRAASEILSNPCLPGKDQEDNLRLIGINCNKKSEAKVFTAISKAPIVEQKSKDLDTIEQKNNSVNNDVVINDTGKDSKKSEHSMNDQELNDLITNSEIDNEIAEVFGNDKVSSDYAIDLEIAKVFERDKSTDADIDNEIAKVFGDDKLLTDNTTQTVDEKKISSADNEKNVGTPSENKKINVGVSNLFFLKDGEVFCVFGNDHFTEITSPDTEKEAAEVKDKQVPPQEEGRELDEANSKRVNLNNLFMSNDGKLYTEVSRDDVLAKLAESAMKNTKQSEELDNQTQSSTGNGYILKEGKIFEPVCMKDDDNNSQNVENSTDIDSHLSLNNIFVWKEGKVYTDVRNVVREGQFFTINSPSPSPTQDKQEKDVSNENQETTDNESNFSYINRLVCKNSQDDKKCGSDSPVAAAKCSDLSMQDKLSEDEKLALADTMGTGDGCVAVKNTFSAELPKFILMKERSSSLEEINVEKDINENIKNLSSYSMFVCEKDGTVKVHERVSADDIQVNGEKGSKKELHHTNFSTGNLYRFYDKSRNSEVAGKSSQNVEQTGIEVIKNTFNSETELPENVDIVQSDMKVKDASDNKKLAWQTEENDADDESAGSIGKKMQHAKYKSLSTLVNLCKFSDSESVFSNENLAVKQKGPIYQNLFGAEDDQILADTSGSVDGKVFGAGSFEKTGASNQNDTEIETIEDRIEFGNVDENNKAAFAILNNSEPEDKDRRLLESKIRRRLNQWRNAVAEEDELETTIESFAGSTEDAVSFISSNEKLAVSSMRAADVKAVERRDARNATADEYDDTDKLLGAEGPDLKEVVSDSDDERARLVDTGKSKDDMDHGKKTVSFKLSQRNGFSWTRSVAGMFSRFFGGKGKRSRVDSEDSAEKKKEKKSKGNGRLKPAISFKRKSRSIAN